MEGSLGRAEWARLPRPMTPVTVARTEDLPRHPVVWIALGLVAASALTTLIVLSRAMSEVPIAADEGAQFVVALAPMMAIVLGPAALAFLAGWIPWHGPVGRWALLVGSAAFAVGNVWANAVIFASDSSTAALGYLVALPALLTWAGLTWGVTEALNRLVPPTTYR